MLKTDRVKRQSCFISCACEFPIETGSWDVFFLIAAVNCNELVIVLLYIFYIALLEPMWTRFYRGLKGVVHPKIQF